MGTFLILFIIYVSTNLILADRKSSKEFVKYILTISWSRWFCSEQFSLFSIVQFPNEECTSASSSTTNGTCYTTSEVQCVIRIFFLIIVYLYLVLVLYVASSCNNRRGWYQTRYQDGKSREFLWNNGFLKRSKISRGDPKRQGEKSEFSKGLQAFYFGEWPNVLQTLKIGNFFEIRATKYH